ncbi:MAG: 5'-3' exonuclease H3TH domain-containing protein, partial [Candidatus Acidiferrum sp.]
MRFPFSSRGGDGLVFALCYTRAMAAKEETGKKLFLVDAMAHVYRAFYAPMVRMNAPSGLPTKVPFLFANILRRLIKDYRPDYLGIVFDTSKPTFRDKLFESYKAHRPPMPDEMSVQLPYVRRLCAAMCMPILELDGYEADDVIGTLAKKAVQKNLDVLVISNDKDMMQLVNSGVRILRTGSGGAKADTIVDAQKVEEILGVPPGKVVDLMALLGDTIDNIPGAKGIGEKGATELIQKFGTVENALAHADEVANKRYREALQQQKEQVLMSKQLAAIETEVPLELDLAKLKMCDPDPAALSELYRELGFNSLLKELLASGAMEKTLAANGESQSGAATDTSGITKDYAQLAGAEELRSYLKKLPVKEPLALWLNLDLGGRDAEGFGTHISSVELSSKPGEGRSLWADDEEEALKAIQPALADEKRRKIVHDPKLFQLLAGKVEKIEHATQLYDYLLRPTTAKHDFADVIFRNFNVPLGGGAG